jgi:hypothetical protein
VAIVRGLCEPGPCVYAGERASPVGSGKAGAVYEGRSSRVLQDEFPQLKKRYWGQHLWARGYFCASVGAVDEETIRKYIESQKWEDPGENFKSPRQARLETALSREPCSGCLGIHRILRCQNCTGVS